MTNGIIYYRTMYNSTIRRQVVDLAFPGYFRIAGDDAHTGFSRRLGHSRRIFFDFSQGEAFFDDEGTRQI